MADTTRQELLVDAARRLGRDAAFEHLGDDEVADAVTTGAAQLAAATARWLAALAELVVRGVWARDGASTPARWLSWACGVADSTAREHVRVALRLRDCPLVAERFATGRLSYSKVRAITRVCTPEIEPMLLAWADAAPAAVLERIVADARRVQRAAEQSAVRDDLGAHARWLDDGTYELVLRVDAATGTVVDQHLDRLVELSHTPGPGGETPVDAATDPRDTSPDGTGSGPDDAGAPHGPTTAMVARPTLAQRRADAIAGALAAAVATGPTDTSGGDRHTVVLHLPATALAAVADHADAHAAQHDLTPADADANTNTDANADAHPGVAVRASAAASTPMLDVENAGEQDHARDDATARDDGRPGEGLAVPDAPPTSADDASSARDHAGRSAGSIAAALVRDGRGRVRAVGTRQLGRLTCSTRLLVVVHRDGTPADLGRASRDPDARLRRLLHARDRSCRFPGCAATRHLHAHHVVWWSRGGSTDLDNLVLLCRHHHALVHDHDWTLRAAGPGRWTFHPPSRGDGGHDERPWPVRRPTAAASADAVALAARVHAPDITPGSLRPPHWDGQPHDHRLAVDVLLERSAA